jgi:hypothetical protein
VLRTLLQRDQLQVSPGFALESAEYADAANRFTNRAAGLQNTASPPNDWH